jgi:hypothetical protein
LAQCTAGEEVVSTGPQQADAYSKGLQIRSHLLIKD